MVRTLNSCLFSIAATLFGVASEASGPSAFDHFVWDEVNEGVGVTWEPRAGLQAVRKRKTSYVLGGLSPKWRYSVARSSGTCA